MKFLGLGDKPWTRRLLLIGLCLGAIGALAIIIFTQKPRSAGFAASGPRPNIPSLLAARSPAPRIDGALIKSKARQYALARPRVRPRGIGPRQYALPRVRERAPNVSIPSFSLGQASNGLQNLAPLQIDPVSSAAAPGSLSPFPIGANSPGDTIIPSTAAVPPQPTLPSSPTLPVPGPEAWINMIAGAGYVGWMVRARRRKLRAGTAG